MSLPGRRSQHFFKCTNKRPAVYIREARPSLCPHFILYKAFICCSSVITLSETHITSHCFIFSYPNSQDNFMGLNSEETCCETAARHRWSWNKCRKHSNWSFDHLGSVLGVQPSSVELSWMELWGTFPAPSSCRGIRGLQLGLASW